MSTIELQLELEATMMQQTAERFHRSEQAAIDRGDGSGTATARRLHKLFLEDTADALEMMLASRRKSAGVGVKYLNLIVQVDPITSVGIALQELFDNAFNTTNVSLQDAFVKIGARIEDDIKFSKFKAEQPDYFATVMMDFKRKGTTNYRHIHRVLTMKLREFNVEWNDWTSLERAKVGDLVSKVIVESTPLFKIAKSIQKGKKSDHTKLNLTAEGIEWVEKYRDYAQYLRPLGGPCIVQPKDWEDLYHGGFYSPEMQSRFSFVRTRHQKHIKDGDFAKHMTAVNKLQHTKWAINPRVRHFLEWIAGTGFATKAKLPPMQPYEFPSSPVYGIDKEKFTAKQEQEFTDWKRETAAMHTKERKRFSEALALHRLFKMVDEYAEYREFYFVYTADFRGRLYPVTSGLSPQGADYSKGVLQFAEAKRLGDRGAYWLAVHGANCYGYDKETFDNRVEFIKSLAPQIRRAAADPCSRDTVDFIANADKPIQFMAFVFEYDTYLRVGAECVTSLPVGLDGSCNGLQNFSAILRDPIGGLATNVLPSDRPNDIYSEVAEVAKASLRAAGETEVLALGIDRKATKRSVMTLPYGLTKHSSKMYIWEWVKEQVPDTMDNRKVSELSGVLNDHVWDAIGKVVSSARAGMAWLQDIASATGKDQRAFSWTTPTGFKVYQCDYRTKVRRVRSALDDINKFNILEYTDKVDVSAMKNGSAPNFIHGTDAAHLVLTTLECDDDVTAFGMVHDEFATHACDIPELHRAIRKAFVKMYHKQDLLMKLWVNIGSQYPDIDFPKPPTMGDMDVREVIHSEYFFG